MEKTKHNDRKMSMDWRMSFMLAMIITLSFLAEAQEEVLGEQTYTNSFYLALGGLGLAILVIILFLYLFLKHPRNQWEAKRKEEAVTTKPLQRLPARPLMRRPRR